MLVARRTIVSSLASTVVPTGSSPAEYRRVESLAIIRWRAISPSSSVEAKRL